MHETGKQTQAILRIPARFGVVGNHRLLRVGQREYSVIQLERANSGVVERSWPVCLLLDLLVVGIVRFPNRQPCEQRHTRRAYQRRGKRILAAATSVAVAPTLVAKFQVSSLLRFILALPRLQNVVTCFHPVEPSATTVRSRRSAAAPIAASSLVVPGSPDLIAYGAIVVLCLTSNRWRRFFGHVAIC
jgi:hypothetical protein